MGSGLQPPARFVLITRADDSGPFVAPSNFFHQKNLLLRTAGSRKMKAVPDSYANQ
jgi:hypothetical protein